jgi:cysteine desulfurase / selenocysteine lyase
MAPGYDVEKIRQDFPILKRLIRGKPLVYLDNAASTQKPSAVIEAVRDCYERHYANIHRGVHTLSEEATAMFEAAREELARFIGAPDPACVIFTRGTTESINLVAQAWGRKNLKAGDEVLLTELEHHSNLVPWHLVAAETGAVLRHIPVTPEGELELSSLSRLLTTRTKLVAFTAVSNALGTINPVEKLAAAARRVGAKVLVDGAQWVPQFPVDVSKLDIDFLAFSGHKMAGPSGIGVLWGRREMLEAMPPFMGGGDMIREVWLDRSTYNDLPYKFEAGTPNIAGAIGLGAAAAYLCSVGLEAARRHEAKLVERALRGLAAEGVRLYGPAEAGKRGGVVSFNIEDLHPHDVGSVLDVEGVAIRAGHHCCQPLMRKYGIAGTARASFYIYNTEEEVDALVRAVRKVKEFFKVAV